MKEKRFRVLSVHWGFLPGGVANYASNIEKVGMYAPISIRSICVCAPGWPIDHTNSTSMDMEFIDIRGRWDISWIWKARQIIKRENPDIILTHGFNGAFLASISTFGLGRPLVSSWHGDYIPTTISQKIAKPFILMLTRGLFHYVVKEIVTVSNFSKQALLEENIPANKITVVYNGIPDLQSTPTNCNDIRRQLGIQEGQLLFGTACRLAVQKGLEWFIRALDIVRKKRDDVKFVIWGEGPQRVFLEKLTESLGIEKIVFFPGYRPDTNICILALDAFVMSSHAEYFSIALLEAMRAGLPIIATDVGGNPEAINSGGEGMLVPAADPQALAEAMIGLIDNSELRTELAKNARRRFLNEFTSDKMVKKTAEWLIYCVHKHCNFQP